MSHVYSKCVSYSDLTAGSPEEREFLQWLASVLDTPYVWMHLSPVEVLYWRDVSTRLESPSGVVGGLAMPYTKPAVVEGKLVEWGKDVESNIAVVEFPRDLDDAKYLAIEAAERGAAAVVFTGGPPRRIVVTGDLGYSMNSAPPPLPVASFGDLSKHLGERVKLEIETTSRVTFSYSLVAFNTFDDSPMVSAHWDHWLKGAVDNCAGVEAAVTTFSELVADDVPIALGLFTAEEGVAPHVPSFYWAWGSLNYLSRWRPNLLVNIDAVGLGTPRMYAPPYLHDQLRHMGPVESPEPHFDSVHYERWGLPSVTVSSLRDFWQRYHSPLDAEVSFENVLYAAELAKRLAKIKPPTPSVELDNFHVDDPHVAWSIRYNYLVLFRDFSHSDVVYVDVFNFLKRRGGEYRRIDLLGGPTLCLYDCTAAFDVYRELTLLTLASHNSL